MAYDEVLGAGGVRGRLEAVRASVRALRARLAHEKQLLRTDIVHTLECQRALAGHGGHGAVDKADVLYTNGLLTRLRSLEDAKETPLELEESWRHFSSGLQPPDPPAVSGLQQPNLKGLSPGQSSLQGLHCLQGLQGLQERQHSAAEPPAPTAAARTSRQHLEDFLEDSSNRPVGYMYGLPPPQTLLPQATFCQCGQEQRRADSAGCGAAASQEVCRASVGCEARALTLTGNYQQATAPAQPAQPAQRPPRLQPAGSSRSSGSSSALSVRRADRDAPGSARSMAGETAPPADLAGGDPRTGEGRGGSGGAVAVAAVAAAAAAGGGRHEGPPGPAAAAAAAAAPTASNEEGGGGGSSSSCSTPGATLTPSQAGELGGKAKTRRGRLGRRGTTARKASGGVGAAGTTSRLGTAAGAPEDVRGADPRRPSKPRARRPPAAGPAPAGAPLAPGPRPPRPAANPSRRLGQPVGPRAAPQPLQPPKPLSSFDAILDRLCGGSVLKNMGLRNAPGR